MSFDDAESIERARQQIRALFDEIRAGARSDVKEADFFSAALSRTLAAMEATGGLIWLVGEQGKVEPVCHMRLEATGLTESPDGQAAHGKLVQTLMGSPTGLLVPPRPTSPAPTDRSSPTTPRTT